MKKISVIGIWHLGIVNSVGFAEKGYTVCGIEFDADKAASLQAGTPPLFEPGLEELMKKHLDSGALSFSAEASAVEGADAIVIAYDSPVNDKDEVDITPVVEAAKAAAPFLGEQTLVVITSQIPLGTAEKVEAEIQALNPNWKSGVMYTPENLKLGQAIDRFLQPDMLVMGASRPEVHAQAMELYKDFDTEKLPMDLRSSEMVKHALNTFLATSITFINEMAGLADRLGADAVAVGKALKFDQRIGQKALMGPGLGFSGGTLARDVTQLTKFSDELGYPGYLLRTIMKINDGTFDEVIIQAERHLKTLEGKTVGVLGLTYKPGTSTMRRSPSIRIIEKLKERGVNCIAYDPKADEKELAEYDGLFTRIDSIDDLAKADALILVTEWPEFAEIDFAALGSKMQQPIMIDTKNFLDPQTLLGAGWTYQGFGRSVGKK